MAKGTGIYISGSTVRWVEADVKNGVPSVLRSGSGQIDEQGSFDLPEDVPEDSAVCFSAERSFFYSLNFPFKSVRKIRAVLKSDIEDKSIEPIESIVADFYTVEKTAEGTRGLGITFPREDVEKGIGITGPGKEPGLVTLDVFAVFELIKNTGYRDGDYFITALNDTSAFMGEVNEGVITRVRSIPTQINSLKAAEDAVHELIKRFDVDNPREDIVILACSSDISRIIQGNDAFPYSLVEIDLDRNDSPEMGPVDLLIPAAAAAAAFNPERYPNLRQEDLAYGGPFYGLLNHGIAVLAMLALFFLTAIIFSSVLKGGYEQEIASLNAITEQEAEAVIGKKKLAGIKGGLTLLNKIKKISKQTSDKNSVIKEEGLPESAFKVLQTLLDYIPNNLDITWKRIMIREKVISLSGEFNAKDTEQTGAYDTFIKQLERSEMFNVNLNNIRKNTFRISLRMNTE